MGVSRDVRAGMGRGPGWVRLGRMTELIASMVTQAEPRWYREDSAPLRRGPS